MTPSGWRSAELGAITQVNPEQLKHRTDPDYVLEYLDIAAIERPGVIGASRTLTFADAPSRARRRARAGDILVSTVRPYLRNFARVGEAPVTSWRRLVMPWLDQPMEWMVAFCTNTFSRTRSSSS